MWNSTVGKILLKQEFHCKTKISFGEKFFESRFNIFQWFSMTDIPRLPLQNNNFLWWTILMFLKWFSMNDIPRLPLQNNNFLWWKVSLSLVTNDFNVFKVVFNDWHTNAPLQNIYHCLWWKFSLSTVTIDFNVFSSSSITDIPRLPLQNINSCQIHISFGACFLWDQLPRNSMVFQWFSIIDIFVQLWIVNWLI